MFEMDLPRSPGRNDLRLSPSQSLEAINSLRRTLSRSPTAQRSYQHLSTTASSRLASSPLTPFFTRSPLRRVAGVADLHERGTQDDTLLTTRRSQPRRSPLRVVRASPRTGRSPIRRALSTQSDHGNSSMSPQLTPEEGQENVFELNFLKKPSPPKSLFDRDTHARNTPAGPPTGLFAISSPKSPIFKIPNSMAKPSSLKRADGIYNLDHQCPGSPSTKRRSQLPRTSSDTSRASSSDNSGDDSDETRNVDSPRSHRLSLPARTSSVRKAKRTSKRVAMSHARRGLDLSGSPSTTCPAPENHHESTTPIRPPPSSTMTRMGELPSHLFTASKPFKSQPHPLSRSVNPNSPVFARPESPNRHKSLSPFPSPDDKRPDFAKSLPVGAIRPEPAGAHVARQNAMRLERSNCDTPLRLDAIRPNPMAFMSTGLISKRHRNPDNMPAPPGARHDMPDTPIKKNPSGVTWGASPATVAKNITQPRFNQPVFGADSSQSFNVATTSLRRTDSTFFDRTPQLNLSSLRRANSTISSDGENSPARALDLQSQSSNDDLPPTPTKLNTSVGPQKPHSLRSSLFNRRPVLQSDTFVPPAEPSGVGSMKEVSRKFCHPSDPTASGPPQATTLQPIGFSADVHCSPCGNKSVLLRSFDKTLESYVNSICPVFPQSATCEGSFTCPQTPFEVSNVQAFPDPSNLSISGGSRNDRSPRRLHSSFSNESFATPETPSTHRAGPQFNAMFATPRHHQGPAHDVDATLLTRFQKVEWFAKGEFSDVFKAAYPKIGGALQIADTLSAAPARSFTGGSVSIVKRSKRPVSNAMRKGEVEAMKALGRHDHIVHFEDDWSDPQGHAYIQTEFCEEGTLSQFIDGVGNKERLDDFRIWKILLEVASGLSHIHACNYVHLDLKPENIFIDFEGVLKIGDFGHASSWPVPRSRQEGEGDRRYLSNESLKGEFDKPVDVFAIGTMMFEIAANMDLPSNGDTWQHLRSGIWSGLPSLTSMTSSSLTRITSGPSLAAQSMEDIVTQSTSYNSFYPQDMPDAPIKNADFSNILNRSTLAVQVPIVQQPDFMKDEQHPDSLDRLVHRMMSPEASQRPLIDEVLLHAGCRWVSERRRAGAVIFEGPWGPLPDDEPQFDGHDVDMMDMS